MSMTIIHDLNKERTNLITQSFNLNIVRAQNHPLARSVAFTAGDFNFLSEGEKPIRVSTHQPIAIDKEKKDGKSQWWTTLMNKCTELHQPDPTRIGSVSLKNKDEKYLIASRIDRIYSSWAPWQLLNLTTKTFTVCPATAAQKDAGSDHTPIGNHTAIRRSPPKGMRPIPKWLAYHPIYQETLQELLTKYDDTKEKDPFEALGNIKHLMRKASTIAPKKIFENSCLSNAEKLQIVLQASRAIVQGNTNLVKKIQKNLPDIGNHLEIDTDGTITLSDPDSFHRKTQHIANDYLQSETTLQVDTNKKPKGGRIAQLHRWMQLWSPFARRAVNVGIIKVDQTVTFESQEKAEEIKSHWGEVFSTKSINELKYIYGP